MQPKNPPLGMLRNVKCFSTLEDEVLKLLQGTMQYAAFEPGQDLCLEGDDGDRMFVIESGEVAVLKRGDQGTDVEVATLGQGDIAGEMSLFGEQQRTATLRATHRAEVWTLTHSAFRQVLEQNCSLAVGMLSCLSQHLCRGTSVVAKLLSQDVDRRFKVAVFDSKPYVRDAFSEQNRHDYALSFFESRLSAETVSLAAGFSAICVFVNDAVTADVVGELAGLGVEMIALRCAGFNNVDVDACERRGISVARVPAYSPYAVAEHAAALMLTLNRRVHRAYSRVREGNFSLNGLVGFDMHGKTAGVVGAGKIGKCMLSILAGFGCRLLAYDMYPDQALVDRLGVRYVELDELLAQADVISLHAPLTPQTHHLIDAEAIAAMKPGVMLINTSRGALVDTAALVEGLKSRKIGAAGLDVYEEESGYFFEDFSDRVITDDVLARLMTFNNVVVTSHQAFLTKDALANIADTTFANLREFQDGKRGGALTNAVTCSG